MGLALCGLDRTLSGCYSGRLWVQEEWRAGHIGLRDVLWAGWWLGRYSLGWEEGLDHVFEVAVARIAGQREDELARRVEGWFEREVAHRLRPGARDALRRHRDRGDRLVLCTSSSPYAARAAVRMFGLDDAISSVFEVRDGRFTGRVEALAMGRGKLDCARAWASAHGEDLDGAAFYTDSHTDLPLLRAVDHPIAVNPDRALLRVARELSWPVEDWGRARAPKSA